MQATLVRSQVIAAPIEAVWDFFSSPANLNELTPADLKFHVVSTLPKKMYAGQLIEYRISVFPFVWMRWLTEIRHVREGEYFVDEQRFGPYSFWYHEHLFEPIAGGVRMTDRVTYRVGYGVLGSLLHRLIIRPKLERIFNYREAAVRQVFGEARHSN